MATGRFNKFVTVAPSDTVDFANPQAPTRLSDAIYVGGAGAVAVVAQDGTVTIFTVIAGFRLEVAARRVNATGTTATAMVALYSL